LPFSPALPPTASRFLRRRRDGDAASRHFRRRYATFAAYTPPFRAAADEQIRRQADAAAMLAD